MSEVLLILQNQWFRDPMRARLFIARNPELRRSFLKRCLFAGCKTGKVLRQVFGNACDGFNYEEASPEIGSLSSSVFPADIPHIVKALTELKPRIVIALGRIASDAALQVIKTNPPHLLTGPHPVARGPETIPTLIRVNSQLESLTATP